MSERPTVEAFLERYVAVWNEGDPAARRESVEALWAPDGAMVNRVRRYTGHAEVAEGVGRSYDAFVARGFRFEADGHRAHHDAVLFLWLMRDRDGEVDSRGANFIQVAGDGRIVLDHQFAEPPEGG